MLTFSGNLAAANRSTDVRTRLEEDRVSQIHNTRMSQCLEAFSKWCCQMALPLEEGLRDSTVMSGLLAHYVQHCREKGLAVWRAKYAVVGVQSAIRAYKGQLRRAWDALKTWESQMPFGNRVPIPKLIVDACALVLAKLGCSRQPCADLAWIAAVLIRMGFWGLLRPGEILALVVADHSLPLAGSGHLLVIAIAKPKKPRIYGPKPISIGVRCGHHRVDQVGLCGPAAGVAAVAVLAGYVPSSI